MARTTHTTHKPTAHTTQATHAPARGGAPEPSARAHSTREVDVPDDKHITRRDPAEVAREAAEEAGKATGTPPQRGISSSELNSADPATKAKATEEAKSPPANTDPKDKGGE